MRAQPDVSQVLTLATAATVALANTASTAPLETREALLSSQLNKLPTCTRLELLKNCQLHYEGMLALLGSDDQIADSEDSLATLLSRYLDSATGQLLTPTQFKTLTDLLRYQHMSNTFLGLELPNMPLLSLDNQQLSRLMYLRGLKEAANIPPTFRLSLVPAAWYEPARKIATRPTNSVQLVFNLSESALVEFLNATVLVNSGGIGMHSLIGDVVEFRGVSWCIILQSVPDRQLIVGVRPAFDSRKLIDHSAGIFAEYQLRLTSTSPTIHTRKIATWIAAAGSGPNNFVQAIGKRPGDPTQLDWWKEYIVDGFVRFTSTVTIL